MAVRRQTRAPTLPRPVPDPPPLAVEVACRAGDGRVEATIGTALADAAGALAAAGIDQPRRRARRLVAAVLGLSDAAVFAHPEHQLGAGEQTRLSDALRRMAAREPLSRIAGRREFWGLELLLSPDTLDPRPDSETLVEAVLARLPDRGRPYRFLDLGTGTGCLLLALLSEYPAAHGVGVDLAPGAARTARRNADRLGFGARASFAVGDWGEALTGRFDAVVVNPPYIETAAIPTLPPEVRDHDPPRALDGGADGLAAYRRIAPQLCRLLPPGGVAALEIGHGQAAAAAAILRRAGLAMDGVARDLAGIERCVAVRAQGCSRPGRPRRNGRR